MISTGPSRMPNETARRHAQVSSRLPQAGQARQNAARQYRWGAPESADGRFFSRTRNAQVERQPFGVMGMLLRLRLSSVCALQTDAESGEDVILLLDIGTHDEVS